MLVAQHCASCHSEFTVTALQYNEMASAYCPACGHLNARQMALTRTGLQAFQRAKAVLSQTGKISKTNDAIAALSLFPPPREETFEVDPRAKKTLEDFRRKVEERGRVFVLANGTGRYDVNLLAEGGWPTIGVDTAFTPYMPDVYVFGANVERVFEYLSALDHRQATRPTTVFIPRFPEPGKKFMRHGKRHGRLVDDQTGKVLRENLVNFAASSVQYYNPVCDFVRDFEMPMSLRSSDVGVETAVNLAVLLGAKEVYVVGMDDTTFLKSLAGELYPVQLCSTQYADPGLQYKQFEVVCSVGAPYYLDALRRRIEHIGKCFVMGAGPSLSSENLSLLFGFPVITTNSAFQKYPHADACAFGDAYFIQHYHDQLAAWQSVRQEKPLLFWQDYGGQEEGRPKLQRVVGYRKGQGSTPVYENPRNSSAPWLSLKHSIITPAINLAYFLGAREIFLIGVELGGGHFFDPDGKIYQDLGKVHETFPHASAIAAHIAKQAKYLAGKAVSLSTCFAGESPLKGMIPYVPLSQAADNRFLSQLFRKE